MPLNIKSPSFMHSGAIPSRHSCDGKNVSPPLEWTGVPDGTKSLALIVDDPDAPDPDAPRTTWVHWVLYNIPPDSKGLRESAETAGLPPGTLQGINDWHRTGYGGPCPPIGRHRYFFKLYALDVLLADLATPAKAVLEKAMRGHIVGHAELIGLYQRGR
jgi:Raf kinase inhibitor-like YbhB/YbcL family protein